VIEGVMGYLDGTGENGMTGSSCHLAAATKTPVILTVNARGMSRSASALVKGFAEYGEDRQIKGVFLNRTSKAMAGSIAYWIADDTGLPVLASLPQEEDLAFSSRHLGLVEPGEIPDLHKRIDRAADLLSETMDLEKLLAIAQSAPELKISADPESRDSQIGDDLSRVTIAVAMDEAFSFYYEDNLELLASYGAQILRFSPIHDSRIPDADGLLLGGGYPELWAEKLSSNKSMRTSIRSAAEAGMPILAECGGFQYLQQELETKDGAVYEMAGVLDGRSAMTGKLVRFGYVALSAKEGTAGEIHGPAAWRKTIYLDPGQTIRGHEFHYSDSTCNGDAFTAVKPNGRHWDCMVAKGRILAGYPHLYYPSCPPLAERFVSACRDYRQERSGTKAKSSASGV
jgi:cobyrinic acid a,c-diamide synthase